MRKSKDQQWLEALVWDDKTLGVPSIVSLEIAKYAGKALRKVKPYKPAIKFPKGTERKSIPWLKKELDRVFSIFIRTRDSNEYGIGRCVTCGYPSLWQKLDAGHYVPRQDLATRWDERNVHPQCKKCNGFRGGEPEKMAAYIDETYGAGAAEQLRTKATGKFKLDRQWLEMKIKYYKGVINE